VRSVHGQATVELALVLPVLVLFLFGNRLPDLARNFGKGIKEPSIYQETNSLYDRLLSVPNGADTISQFGIHPFRAVQARTYDGGVQQTLLHGKARLSFTYFHNEFGDQAEFVPTAGLLDLGVPQDVVTELQSNFIFGAIVNSLSYRAQGVELEAEYRITRNLAVRGGWTYTDAVVQKSFAGDPKNPYNVGNPFSNVAFNPAFPGIPIGAISPLVGARPFRVAPNTGFIAVDWSTGRFTVRATGTLVSRRDDSDFLGGSDVNFGNSLLLPNRNLDPAYQKIDLYGSFRVNSHMRLYTSMENLLNQRYYESFGYPALPFTFRSGVQFRLGGESWKL
jgi:iron complex outermembrane receptor protein/vitamin B12 transporter